MAALFLVAVMTVLAALVIISRINLKRFLGYPNTVDIMFTCVMVVLFHGTFAGMVVGGFACLFMSATLWILRSSIGCERLSIKRTKYGATLYWRVVPASECNQFWLFRLFSNRYARSV